LAHDRLVRRRVLAIVTCLLWLAGVELLPALHQAGHADAAPHTHAADGMVITVSFGEPAHRHDDGVVHRHDDAKVRYGAVKPGRDGTSRLRDQLDHAAGLAHHALALRAEPPPITEPVPVDRLVTFVEPAAVHVLASATVPEAAARGPPAFAS